MIYRSAMLSLLAFFLYFPLFSQITYVSQGGNGDGTSWNQPMGDLRVALLNAESGGEIWVSAGTYLPNECSDCDFDDRNQSFEIPNQVQIYGGFNGTETLRMQRDWLINETILSGDINQDNQPDSNAFTIVYFENVDSSTVIDGFTIRDGSANGTNSLFSAESLGRSGAGIYNFGSISSEPIIRNCKFLDHFADTYGAAISNNGREGGRANPSIIDCSFLGNFAIRSGGAIYNDAGRNEGESSPIIDNCFFQNNTSIFGGAIYNNGFGGTVAPLILNSTFTENTGTSIAGAVYSFAKDSLGLAAPVFANCIFVDNYGKSSGAIYTLSSSGKARPLIFNSVFYENSANTGGAVYCNESGTGDTEVTMFNNIFFGNTAIHNPIFHMSGSGTPIMNLYNSMVQASDCEDVVQLDDTDSLFCGQGIIYDQDPLFVDPLNFDFRLQPNSPAIDAGNNQVVLDNNILYDLDSLVRIFNLQVDIGPFEYNDFIPTFISTQPNSQNLCEGDDIFFDVETTGTNPISFQWFKDGQSIPGEDQENLFINNIILSDNGNYHLEILTAIGDTLVSDTASIVSFDFATPSLRIVASEDDICANTPVSFTIDTISFAGDSPTYQWLRNDVEVGLSQPSYTTQSLADGDEIRCVLTSSRDCVTSNLVFSNNIIMEVTEVVIPTINISADASEICITDSITFTANITNGGSSPQIDWLKNGVVFQQNTTTVTLNDLISTDIFEVKIISSESCASSQPVFSEEISVEVLNAISLAINISTNNQTICQGEMVDFVATSENAGSNPTYEWFINNQTTGATESVFTTNNLINNDQVSCQVTSTEDCLEENMVISSPIEITVNPLLEVSAEIATTQTEICNGALINFTSSVVNGGLNPSYQWQVNGNPIGQNLPTFTSDDLNDGDQVSLEVVSSESCLAENTVNTISIDITVNPVLPLSVNIIGNVTSICEGEPIAFTATPENAGPNPTYQWMVNGVNVGDNMSTYTSSNFTENDEVTCQVTSMEACLSNNIATSEALSIGIIELVVPSISIATSAVEICQNELVTFTAEIIDGGTNPIIQWYLNNDPVGTGESVFTIDQLNSEDLISVSVISSSNCASSDPITSEDISVNVLELQPLMVEVMSEQGSACTGEIVTFTAISENEGESPSYFWTINGVEIADNNSSILQHILTENAEVICTITNEEDCLIEHTVSSDAFQLEVIEIIDPMISISLAQDSICVGEILNFSASFLQEGVNPQVEWFVNGLTTGNNGEFFTVSNLEEGDLVTAVLSVSEDCTTSQSVSSNELIIDFLNCNTVGLETIIDNKNIVIFPNPASENFDIKITAFQGKTELNIYDIHGKLLLQKEVFISQTDFILPVDSRSFPAGTYFINLINNSTNNITRLIIK